MLPARPYAQREVVWEPHRQHFGKGRRPLLQVNGLIMPGRVELCAPHLVYALVLRSAEGHRRPEPNSLLDGRQNLTDPAPQVKRALYGQPTKQSNEKGDQPSYDEGG